MLVTWLVLPDGPSVATRAKINSFPAEVVKAGVEMVLDGVELSPQVCASTISAAGVEL